MHPSRRVPPHTQKLLERLTALIPNKGADLCDFHRGFMDAYTPFYKHGHRFLDMIADSREYENGYTSGDRAYKYVYTTFPKDGYKDGYVDEE